MQDELLMDKSPAQQRQPQAPQEAEVPRSPDPPEESPGGLQQPHGKERMQLEALPGLSFPQEPSFGSSWAAGTEEGGSFFQGAPPVNGALLFQNFPHLGPVFGGGFSPQLGLAHPQQQPQRRSPGSPNPGPYAAQRSAYSHPPALSSKPAASSWSSNPQSAAWSSHASPWGGAPASRDPRRALGVPSALNPISPLKKPFSSSVIAPPKFPRAAPLPPKSWMEESAFRTDGGNPLLPFQDRNRPYDTFNLHSLENSLMDMIRTDHEPLKGRMGINFHHPATENIMALNSPQGPTKSSRDCIRTGPFLYLHYPAP